MDIVQLTVQKQPVSDLPSFQQGNESSSGMNFHQVMKNSGAEMNQQTETVTQNSEEIMENQGQVSMLGISNTHFPLSLTEIIDEATIEFSLDTEKSLDMENHSDSEEQLMIDENMPIEDLTNISLEEYNMMIQLIQEINQLFSQFELDENPVNVGQRLLALLEQWGKMTDRSTKIQEWNQLMSKLSSKETADIWNEIASAYSRRTALATQNMYQMDASVTKEDVLKWLDQSIAKYFGAENNATPFVTADTQSTLNQQTIPMSAIQQYTIHLGPSERVDAISNELMQQLGQVVKNSQFLKGQGIQQLTLNLRPENLGDITIRLVQMNGEMTVKFIVSSQATKQLLENHMHQLKPMFAPHQIAIERDGAIIDKEFYQEEQETFEEKEDEETTEEQLKEQQETIDDQHFQQMLNMLREEATINE